MCRAIAYILILLVVLAGCGGPTKGADSSTAPEPTSSLSSSPSSSPSSSSEQSAVPTEPAESTVPAESDRPTGGGGDGGGGDGGGDGGGGGGGGDGGGGGGDSGGGGGEDKRNIEFGGPTLDNTYPLNPWALRKAGMTSCVVFTNPRFDVTVTVRSVRLVNQQPSKDPGLALGANPSTHEQCRPGRPGDALKIKKLPDDCIDAKLEPKERTGCPVVVEAVGRVGTDYTATLTLRLSATCTELVGEPCAKLAGRSNPTATDPVTVTWTETRKYCSCLIPRDDGGGSPEEEKGRCPPVDKSTEASPSESESGSEEETGSGEETGSDQPDTSEEGQPTTEGGDAEDTGPTSQSPSASADGG
jgi:hypothetical protein